MPNIPRDMQKIDMNRYRQRNEHGDDNLAMGQK